MYHISVSENQHSIYLSICRCRVYLYMCMHSCMYIKAHKNMITFPKHSPRICYLQCAIAKLKFLLLFFFFLRVGGCGGGLFVICHLITLLVQIFIIYLAKFPA